ncbi:MAG: JAB domain-containing protein [Halanaerobiales bacterium]
MLNTYCGQCGKQLSRQDVLGIGRFELNSGKFAGKTFIAFKCPACNKKQFRVLNENQNIIFTNKNYFDDNIDYNLVIKFYKKLKCVNTVTEFLTKCNSLTKKKISDINKPIIQPLDVYHIFKDLNQKNKKRLLVLILDYNKFPLAWEMLGEGTGKRISFNPRIILNLPLLLNNRVGVIIAENLNKNINQPDRQKVSKIKKIARAAKLLDIKFIDHIIIDKNDYHSFDQLNLL